MGAAITGKAMRCFSASMVVVTGFLLFCLSYVRRAGLRAELLPRLLSQRQAIQFAIGC